MSAWYDKEQLVLLKRRVQVQLLSGLPDDPVNDPGGSGMPIVNVGDQGVSMTLAFNSAANAALASKWRR
jgi:hypothetical protein